MPTHPHKQGSLTLYTPELMAEICDRYIQDGNIKRVCMSDERFPHWVNFFKWLVRYPEAASMWVAAREANAHVLEERALEVAEQMLDPTLLKTYPKEQINALDKALQQYRWSASKRHPRMYSDKIPPNATVAVQINTTLPLGNPDAVAGGDLNTLTFTATIPPTTPEGEVMDERHFNLEPPRPRDPVTGERKRPGGRKGGKL